MDDKKTVAIDRFAPSVQARLSSGTARAGVVGDAVCLPFLDKSIDGVLAADLIEHLSREDGKRLLDELERVANRVVVVITPNGFLHQPPDPSNPLQEHISGWHIEDFTSRGYVVRGVKGPRILIGEYSRPRLRPEWLWRGAAQLINPMITLWPAWASSLLAYKRVAATNDRRERRP